MAGLDPVIHAVWLAQNADVLHWRHLVDARIKSGHDDLKLIR
jgi:hypothetical protein